MYHDPPPESSEILPTGTTSAEEFFSDTPEEPETATRPATLDWQGPHMADITIDVPLRITIAADGTQRLSTVPGTAALGVASPTIAAVDIDPDYNTRKGYDQDFLGTRVPLPVLTAAQRQNAAKNSKAKRGVDNAVLPYHHFSIVMNRQRQLSYYTAVNINGARSRKPERKGDQWYFDPRIAQSEQIGEDLYKRNELDRGHLVRRLDPAWGGVQEALLANNDTFHFTNCSPQHADFNQNTQTWQGIENFLLNKATSERKRLTIFTGPVLHDDDPLYRGVRLPVRFWKIAVSAKAAGKLAASAYVLEQEELLVGLAAFEPKTFQVTISEIVQRTGLDFKFLEKAEVKLAAAAGASISSTGMVRQQLNSVGDITL
jgi:endonuclease G, mitochondrial